MLRPFPFWLLLDWYHLHGRSHLPWRTFTGISQKDIAYRVWLSEILLQQTQAPRVVDFFNRILVRFPNIKALAEADYETFFPYYDGLGYYSRARNLLSAAGIVSNEWDGVFPCDAESLKKLPGVGPYTAEAIRAFAYNIPTLSFDTNLEKVFSRYYFGDRFRKLTASEKCEILSHFMATGFSAREINAALMDFANIISLNSKAKVDFTAPIILVWCRFFETQGALEPDKKAKTDIFPTKDARMIILLSDHLGKVWYSQEMTNYAPFFLSPNPDLDHRSVVKSYFLEKMNLAVSVRPAFAKKFVDDIPYVFYRARVQVGDTRILCEHSKKSQEMWFSDFTQDQSLGIVTKTIIIPS